MFQRHHIFIVVMLTIQLFAAAWVAANPSHKAPDATMPVHNKEFSPELHQAATGLYESAKKSLDGLLEKEKRQAFDKMNPEELGNTYLAVTRMNRAAQQLLILGEPSGQDFELRATRMHDQLLGMIVLNSNTPPGEKYIALSRQFIAKTGEARNKVLLNLQKLVAQEKWETAEKDLYKVYDVLIPKTVFLTPQEQKSIYEPFSQVEGSIMHALNRIRSQKAGELLTKAMQDVLPNYPNRIQEINAAIGEVGANGTANWNGASVTGPQLVDGIGQRWRETQIAALQARGKHWALHSRKNYLMNDPVSAMSAETGDVQGSDKFAADYAAFSGQVMKAIATLVDADGKRVAPEMAPQLYVEYLRALAPLVRQTNNREFAVQVEAGLGSFLAKNPTLGNDVKAYGLATNELLQWRARVAQATASARSAEYAPIEQRFRDGTQGDNEYTGLFPQQGAATPQMHTFAPAIMPTATKRMMGQKTTVRDSIRLPGESKAAIARYLSRTYANVPAPLALSKEVEALQLDLFVSEQAPPLTLAATQAVLTAQRGDMVAVGGEISGTYLEALITRFAAIPNSAAVLTTLGQLPQEQLVGGAIINMLMRFDIAPHWAMHDYFFIELAAPGNAVAAQ